MTKRSVHIPMLTKMETIQRRTGLVRTRRNHSAWRMTTLQSWFSQNTPELGPNGRPTKNWYRSNGEPEYHATKSSMMYE